MVLSVYGPGCVKSVWFLDDYSNVEWHVYVDGEEVQVPRLKTFGDEKAMFPWPLAGANFPHSQVQCMCPRPHFRLSPRSNGTGHCLFSRAETMQILRYLSL